MDISTEEINKISKVPDLATAEISPMTPEEAIEELSDVAVRMLCGAEIYEGHHFNPKMVKLSLGGMEQIIHEDDLLIAKWAADKANREYIRPGHLELMTRSLPYMLQARKWIRQNLLDHFSKKDSKVRVLFLRGDNSGCGYWRVKLPGEFLRDSNEDNNLDIYISDLEIDYSKLINYDVIYVQRVLTFEHYYILDSLKRAGKKIIYEIDDDVFNIESHNPAAAVFKRFDSQLCIRHCLAMADAVVVTTERLAEVLGIKDKAIIYPNSLDWSTLFQTGYKDPNKTRTRIFWSGSNTHDNDFNVCINALMRVFVENEDVELFIMGGAPKIIIETMSCFQDRIFICPGMHTEAYFHYLRHNLDADIGIIPLTNSKFNHSKSTCKGLEYTMANIPIIASNFPPYSDVYENNEDALLCEDEEEWYQSIIKLLENKEMRDELIKKARKKAIDKFNLRKNAIDFGNKIAKIGNEVVINRNSQKIGCLKYPEVAYNR